MTIYYIDPGASVNGSGTPSSPFNTLAGIPVAAGNKYRIKRGSTFTGAMPSLTAGTDVNTITTVEAYAFTNGSDDVTLPKPIINLGDTNFPGGLTGKAFSKFSNLDIRST